jgi:site-specific recombinase XerC
MKHKGETDMNELAIRASKDIQDMAAILVAYPSPDKWTQEQKAQAVNFAALLDTAQKMIAVKGIAGIDWQEEKAVFLDNAIKSAHTRTGYRAALSRLDAWAATRTINPLEMTPAQADDFIYAQKATGAAPATVRLTIAAASSFYTFLHRRHTAVENPFRGTKALPAKKAVRETAIPDTKEVKAIIAALPTMEAAAAAVMAYRGLRAGGLPGMTITGTKFETHSKGKDIKGNIPAEAIERIKAAGLTMKSPFAGILPNTLEHRIARAIEKLHRAGKVRAAYSAHDLRHFYAVTEYRKDKDIHRVSKLLNHASISVTENYLKGLGEAE